MAGATGGVEGDFRSVYGCKCCLLLGTPSQTHVGLRLCQFSGPRSAQSSGRIKLTITAAIGPGGLNRTHPVGLGALGSSPKWLAEARGPSPGPPRVARPSPTPFLPTTFFTLTTDDRPDQKKCGQTECPGGESGHRIPPSCLRHRHPSPGPRLPSSAVVCRCGDACGGRPARAHRPSLDRKNLRAPGLS